jgi:hypothetical protein
MIWLFSLETEVDVWAQLDLMQIFEAHRASSILSFTVGSDAQVDAVRPAKSTGIGFSAMHAGQLAQLCDKSVSTKSEPTRQ